MIRTFLPELHSPTFCPINVSYPLSFIKLKYFTLLNFSRLTFPPLLQTVSWYFFFSPLFSHLTYISFHIISCNNHLLPARDQASSRMHCINIIHSFILHCWQCPILAQQHLPSHNNKAYLPLYSYNATITPHSCLILPFQLKHYYILFFDTLNKAIGHFSALLVFKLAIPQPILLKSILARAYMIIHYLTIQRSNTAKRTSASQPSSQ